MNNKLAPIIINNPCQKGWGYRTRDAVITLATLVLWVLVLARLYAFFIAEEAVLEQLYGSPMIKLVGAGFIATFIIFHCWAVYNQYLYARYLKHQLHHGKPPTLKMVDKLDSSEIISIAIQEQEKATLKAPTQTVS